MQYIFLAIIAVFLVVIEINCKELFYAKRSNKMVIDTDSARNNTDGSFSDGFHLVGHKGLPILRIKKFDSKETREAEAVDDITLR